MAKTYTSVNVRPKTARRFKGYCKKFGIIMTAKLDEIINAYLDHAESSGK